MKILVTGGAGFIGSNFVHYMLDKHDHQIINLDLLTYAGDLENLKDVADHPNYTFVKGDICDRDLVDDIFREHEISVVINFAAESHVDRSIDNPDIFVQTNVIGTQVLLDIAKNHWKLAPDDRYSTDYRDGVKFIQVSTDEVYGELGETGYFTEETPLAPNSPYSASKAGADMLVRAYYETYKLPMNITRCSNNYGPYQYPEKLIPLMIGQAMKNKKLPVYGDGLQVRDWLHVYDHCVAIDTVMQKGQSGEVYNIGGNNEMKNIDLVKLILKELGKSEGLISFVEDRPGHDRRYAIDNSKITSQLGWSPSYSFEEGIKETLEWYQKNDD